MTARPVGALPGFRCPGAGRLGIGLNGHLDLTRLDLLALLKSDLQYAIVKLGVDRLQVDCRRKSEGTGKATIGSLNPVVFAPVFHQFSPPRSWAYSFPRTL